MVTRGRVILVKHAQPLLDATKPAREWELTVEGEQQSRRLAASLRRFVPCRLVTSPEPKALRTSEIVARELRISMTAVDGLREIDRPILPVMSPSERQRINSRIFTEPDRPVIGSESARKARERFVNEVLTEIGRTDEDDPIVVAHGTVISLLVGEYNNVDPFQLWQRLQCPSFVVLTRPALRLVDVVDRVPSLSAAEGITSEMITVTRAELTDEVSRGLIAALNAELSGLYPEPGANHFQLDLMHLQFFRLKGASVHVIEGV